jgi:hypothetical protein
VMIRRAFDTSQSVAEGFLCLETSVSYVLKLDTVSPTNDSSLLLHDASRQRPRWPPQEGCAPLWELNAASSEVMLNSRTRLN